MLLVGIKIFLSPANLRNRPSRSSLITEFLLTPRRAAARSIVATSADGRSGCRLCLRLRLTAGTVDLLHFLGASDDAQEADADGDLVDDFGRDGLAQDGRREHHRVDTDVSGEASLGYVPVAEDLTETRTGQDGDGCGQIANTSTSKKSSRATVH